MPLSKFDASSAARVSWVQIAMLLITCISSASGVGFSAWTIWLQSREARRATQRIERHLSTARSAGAVRLAVTLALLKNQQNTQAAQLAMERSRVAALGRQLNAAQMKLQHIVRTIEVETARNFGHGPATGLARH